MTQCKKNDVKRVSGKAKVAPSTRTSKIRNEYLPRTPELMNQSKNRTAVHEAGHVVIGHFFEIPTEEVSIQGTVELAGYMISADKRDERSYLELERAAKVRLIENRICLTMAGTIAESMLFGEPMILPGAGADFELVDSLFDSLYDQPSQLKLRKTHFLYLWEMTCEDVRRFFPVIREVATVLEREQFISCRAKIQGFISEIADYYQIRELVRIRGNTPILSKQARQMLKVHRSVDLIVNEAKNGYDILVSGAYLGTLIITIWTADDGVDFFDAITLRGGFDQVLFHIQRTPVSVPGLNLYYLTAFCDYLAALVGSIRRQQS